MSGPEYKKIIKKASQSQCKFKICAYAYTKKGNFLGSATNSFRFNKYGGGIHAERALMQKYGNRISYIIICRVNKNGKVLPIEPCETCQKIADKLNIRIHSIKC